MNLTKKQQQLLLDMFKKLRVTDRRDTAWLYPLPSCGARFVHGAEVRMAKALEKLELLTVEDNGYLAGNNERWWCLPTQKGAEFAKFLILCEEMTLKP